MKTKYFILLMFLILQEDVFSQAVGTPFTPFLIPKGLVVSKTGRIWMDKNLGAKRVATSPSDSLAFGFYYQWGRGSDGHQERLSTPYYYNNYYYLSNVQADPLYSWREGTNFLSGSADMTNAIDNFDRNNPGLNAKYITQSFLESPEHKYFLHIREKNDLNAEYQYNPNTRIYDFKFTEYDWHYPSNDQLWQGINGTNNPCPLMFRLPTESEWSQEISSWDQSFIGFGAFNSYLRLPAASYRLAKTGYFDLFYRGEFQSMRGYYWSSTIANTLKSFTVDGVSKTKIQHFAKYLDFGYNFNEYADYPDWEYYANTNGRLARSNGLSVRCILDQSYSIRDLTLGDYSIYSDYSYWHP
jgi:hypothetical protein